MFKLHGVPPMQEYQSKAAMIELLGGNSIQSKRRSKRILDEPTNIEPPEEIPTCDMDIDDGEGNVFKIKISIYLYTI